MKVLTIVGARPQFIKTFSVSRALSDCGATEILVHTGQHFDTAMSEIFFEQLGLLEPAYNLGIAGGPHGQMTGRMLEQLEAVMESEKPGAVIVYGDTNSTLAGGLAAAKLHIPVVHVEAGLRSHNRRMPEEINRVLVDHLSSLLCCPTVSSVAGLAAEGIGRAVSDGLLAEDPESQGAEAFEMLAGGPVVANTGDVMLDALQHFRSIARDRSSLLERLDLTPGGYAALTIHRAENTADAAALERVLAPVAELAESLPVIFPVHPRTRQLLESGGARFASLPGLRLCDPLPYLDFIELEANAKAILTDSGGVQKEAFFLSVPCLTLRRETEWVETVEAGWNKVVGQQPVDLAAELDEFLDRAPAKSDAFGRGDAGLRIARLTETLFA